jgi:hypothetical protein
MTTKTKKKTTTIFIAELPEVFGYGIIGYGETPEEAEALVKKDYFATVRRSRGTFTARPWQEAKEYWGLSIIRATTGTVHWHGQADYVESF